jgi:glycosyltransferase involved in cell wall biosynthesis
MKKLKVWRWYSFLPMQGRVSRKLSRIITVSECSKKDIAREFNIPLENFKVVPNGINTDYFYPLKKIHREDNHLIVTNSADTPLKGLCYLLDAVDSMRKTHKIKLTVIGEPKKNGAIDNMVRDLQLTECVHFAGRIAYEEFAGYYARASVAVIPSIYEGFGMPAGEAMACGIPVISTTGGALPEVVGDAGILVPPGDARSLEQAIVSLLDDRDKREKLGEAGLRRVKGALTWRHAADKIIDIYHEAIDANGRL